jgi:hypothetical protein
MNKFFHSMTEAVRCMYLKDSRFQKMTDLGFEPRLGHHLAEVTSA